MERRQPDCSPARPISFAFERQFSLKELGRNSVARLFRAIKGMEISLSPLVRPLREGKRQCKQGAAHGGCGCFACGKTLIASRDG